RKMIEDRNAERIDIVGRADLAVERFRGQVSEAGISGGAVVGGAQEAEVAKLPAALDPDDVGGLHVAMQMALRMNVSQSCGHATNQISKFGILENFARAYDFTQRCIAQLCRQEYRRSQHARANFAGRTVRNDVIVVEPGQGPDFVQDLAAALIGIRSDDLDGYLSDDLAQRNLIGGEHAAIRAMANKLAQT